MALSPQTHGPFNCEPTARPFGQEGAAKQPLGNGIATQPSSLYRHVDASDDHSRTAVLQENTKDVDEFAIDGVPGASPQLLETFSQCGAISFAAGACEATSSSHGEALTLMKPKIIPAHNSSTQPLATAMHDCAGSALQLPSPDVTLHACPSPAACFSPTVDYPSQEVCMKLGSSSFAFGIALMLQSDSKHVQASSPRRCRWATHFNSQFC